MKCMTEHTFGIAAYCNHFIIFLLSRSINRLNCNDHIHISFCIVLCAKLYGRLNDLLRPMHCYNCVNDIVMLNYIALV